MNATNLVLFLINRVDQKVAARVTVLKKKSAFRSFIDRAVLHPVELKKHSKYD